LAFFVTDTVFITKPSGIGRAIAQLTEDTKIAKYHVRASYVNLTQMCQANDKKLNNYMRMEGTKAYWEALSTETRISVSALVITIKGGNDKQAIRHLGTPRNCHRPRTVGKHSIPPLWQTAL
jgi:hypothetical protein